MLKPKYLVLSNFLLLIVLTINSVIYIYYDFLDVDLMQLTSIYGIAQLIVSIFGLVTMFSYHKIKFKVFSELHGLFHFIFLVFQILPAFLWFYFHGRAVSDSNYGFMGNMIYGIWNFIPTLSEVA